MVEDTEFADKTFSHETDVIEIAHESIIILRLDKIFMQ